MSSAHPMQFLSMENKSSKLRNTKAKVVPHASVRGGKPVREDTYPELSVYEVGWPVPLFAPSSLVLPTGTHSLLGEHSIRVGF